MKSGKLNFLESSGPVQVCNGTALPLLLPLPLRTYILTYLLTYLLTSLLTPWCRVLLEKLSGLQLVKKFPTFHRTRRFITALTSVRHLSLSWASPIQSIYPHPTVRKVKSKNWTLVPALRLCTGRTAHSGSRGIALLFLDHGTRRRWGDSVTPRPLFYPGNDPVPIVKEAGWSSGSV